MKKLLVLVILSLLVVGCASGNDNKEYIGIIAAMDEELEAIVELVDGLKEEKIGYFTYLVGEIGDQDVIITKSGVGKSLSAMTTTALISNFKISKVINIGVAGALQEEVKVGDIVVSDRIALSDFDLTGFGTPQSFETERFSFAADEELVAALKGLNMDNMHFGSSTSSDTFISSPEQVKGVLDNFPTSLSADMEAGSIAMVLNEFDIPFVIVRAMSDNAVSTEENTIEYEDFKVIASKNSAEMTVKLIESLGK